MGDPKFPRRVYATPFHPWKAERISEENGLQHKFGLKNKKEVWRAKSHLRALRGQARELLARARTGEPQAQKEAQQLLRRLSRLGVLSEGATLDDVLALKVEQVLTRRLQTQVYLKGYTASVHQARQFINHGHVSIGAQRINVPGYYVKRGEEDLIVLRDGSTVADDAHPVRPKRTEGQGPPKLKEYKPRVTEPMRRGPPRGPPRDRRPPHPAAPAAAPAAPAPTEAKAAEGDERRRPRREPRTQGGGAF